MKHSLKNQELLNIESPTGAAFGGSQEWYRERWHRLSGCGPTAASNVVWYLARSRPELGALCDVGGADRTRFVRLMDEMFTFVTPGLRGVNTPYIFADGLLRYGMARGVAFVKHTLEIKKNRDVTAVRGFIDGALERDLPIGFLNLSNGGLYNLEGWHWVTLVAFDGERMTADISDQGRLLEIDFGKWLETSRLGGALAYVSLE